MPTLSPDSKLAVRLLPSPNHDERHARIDMIVLHYTGMADAQDALARLCDPAAKVSSHYVVLDDGSVCQLVPEARRAWHAGVSGWEGVRDINARSIGIEIANPGHDFGCPDFPPAQIDAVIALCRDILARHAIRADRVLAHSDVAPRRKNDPGEKFPWAQLHDAGIGLWVAPAPITAGATLASGDSGEPVRRLQAKLAAYGYDVAVTGAYDADTAVVVTAFQRHFRPARVDGVADVSTVLTLDALLAARDTITRARR
jgi:N-acetylmuramoyl-L-alanine amidase